MNNKKFENFLFELTELNDIQLKSIIKKSSELISDNVSISTPEDLEHKLSFLKFKEEEHLCLITLNSSNQVINIRVISIGNVNNTMFDLRVIFKYALLDNSAAIMLAHNHPSGSLTPSMEDYKVTKKLCKAAEIIGIPVIDHIIVSIKGMQSLCRTYPDMFEKTLH